MGGDPLHVAEACSSKSTDHNLRQPRKTGVMIGILTVAGHGAQLEKEIAEDESDDFVELLNVPKALLPARRRKHSTDSGPKILDCWWDLLKSRQQFREIYLVTNADKYKHFERWATANDFPIPNIINDGSTNRDNSIGAMADLELTIRSKQIQDDIFVVAGDMVFDQNFSIEQLLEYFKYKKGDLAIYYELEETKSTEHRGIVEVDHTTGKIMKFLEKPKSHETTSRLACPVFYCFRKTTLPLISEYNRLYRNPKDRAFGSFMSWLIGRGHTIYGMKLASQFQLIGKVNLSEYKQWIDSPIHHEDPISQSSITFRSYARVGLIGNPSDGFNGKTISLSIKNFWAEVTIKSSAKLKLCLHPLHDPTEFGSLSDLCGISRREGKVGKVAYYHMLSLKLLSMELKNDELEKGGLRLLQATCKKFYEHCSINGIALAKRNFTLSYETNIPRQVGLAGSSAIVSSTLKCLMAFFNLSDDDIPKPKQPNFVLDVETSELDIQAGLQDRVIQIYEGLVYMDFNKKLMDSQNHGDYVQMNVSDLPPLWLAYLSDPSDSGKIHSTVKERWKRGDVEIVEGMKVFAQITDEAKTAIEKHDTKSLASLMDRNFEQRRKLYSDAVLGENNLKMIKIAKKYGSSAKFCGSGGAIVGLCLDEDKKYEMMQEFQSEGFVVCDLKPFNGLRNDH